VGKVGERVTLEWCKLQ